MAAAPAPSRSRDELIRQLGQLEERRVGPPHNGNLADEAQGEELAELLSLLSWNDLGSALELALLRCAVRSFEQLLVAPVQQEEPSTPPVMPASLRVAAHKRAQVEQELRNALRGMKPEYLPDQRARQLLEELEESLCGDAALERAAIKVDSAEFDWDIEGEDGEMVTKHDWVLATVHARDKLERRLASGYGPSVDLFLELDRLVAGLRRGHRVFPDNTAGERIAWAVEVVGSTLLNRTERSLLLKRVVEVLEALPPGQGAAPALHPAP